MKLSEQQTRILSALASLGHAPIPRIAKMAKVREHVARNALRYLTDLELLKPYLHLNLLSSGYSLYVIYFTTHSAAQSTRLRVAGLLAKSDKTVWAAEFAGQFQYGFGLLASSIHEVNTILAALAEAGGGISSKSVTVRTKVESLPMHFFANSASKSLVMTEESLAREIPLSPIDHQVLYALSHADSFSLTNAAKLANMPISSLKYNVNRLERLGIIRGISYKFNYEKFGLNLYKIIISARGIDLALEEGLREFAFNNRATSVFIRCLGSWDFEVTVIGQSSQDIFDYAQRLNDRFGIRIQRFEIMNCCKDYKCVDYPFKRLPSK